jgi:hypothetical protein
MNLQEEIVKELGTQMQSEIDFHILSDMLIQLGWRKVELLRFNSREHAVDVKLWCKENIKNPWECRGSTFIFEDSKDANWFILKWSSNAN